MFLIKKWSFCKNVKNWWFWSKSGFLWKLQFFDDFVKFWQKTSFWFFLKNCKNMALVPLKMPFLRVWAKMAGIFQKRQILTESESKVCTRRLLPSCSSSYYPDRYIAKHFCSQWRYERSKNSLPPRRPTYFNGEFEEFI